MSVDNYLQVYITAVPVTKLAWKFNSMLIDNVKSYPKILELSFLYYLVHNCSKTNTTATRSMDASSEAMHIKNDPLLKDYGRLRAQMVEWYHAHHPYTYTGFWSPLRTFQNMASVRPISTFEYVAGFSGTLQEPKYKRPHYSDPKDVFFRKPAINLREKSNSHRPQSTIGCWACTGTILAIRRCTAFSSPMDQVAENRFLKLEKMMENDKAGLEKERMHKLLSQTIPIKLGYNI